LYSLRRGNDDEKETFREKEITTAVNIRVISSWKRLRIRNEDARRRRQWNSAGGMLSDREKFRRNDSSRLMKSSTKNEASSPPSNSPL